VNVASITGRNPAALQGAYAASKAGVIGFTASLAFDMGPLNVTVNAICPGIVRTPIWDRILEKEARETGDPPMPSSPNTQNPSPWADHSRPRKSASSASSFCRSLPAVFLVKPSTSREA